jgi:iron complex outermembrane receptor protein
MAGAELPFQTAKRNFDIPAGNLVTALTAWAKTSGLKILAPTDIVKKLHTAGVSGEFTAEEALNKLLADTALQYHVSNKRHVTVYDPRAVLGAHAQATSLDTINVEERRVSEAKQGTGAASRALPVPYAGGQVATGGQLGMLGNRSVMDTPFNQTSYTAQTIQNQQARTIADVLMNDPSVRVKTPGGSGTDGLYIRGFYYDSGDYALNGLYGMAPFYSSGANFVERVEVMKGPGALLNGMPPAGAVGGNINLVTKRAPDIDITQLTATYASKSLFGTDIDVSRRYGENKEFGIRFNGGYKNGNTAFDRQKEEFGNATIGLDYRTERARFSADIGYQSDSLSPPLRFITFTTTPPFPSGGLTTVPPAPSAGTNYMPSWAKWTPKDTFLTARGEVDLTDSVTAYAAVGYHDSTNDFIYPSPRIVGTGAVGNWTATPFKGTDTYRTFTGETGLRASVETGPINHLLTVNYSATNRDYDSVGLSPPLPAGTITSNIYNPSNAPFPNFTNLAQSLATTTSLSSVGFADTMSVLNNRLQVTVGVRRLDTKLESFNRMPGINYGVSSADRSAWSPAYAVVIKPVENISLYANYIEGLKSAEAVTGPGSYSNVGEIIPPAQTKQTEVGIKMDMGRITATASAFDITNPNVMSVAVAGQPLPARKLNGEQRNRGVEFNVFGEVTPDVRLLGGIALIEGRVISGSASSGATLLNFSGKTAVGVPVVNLNLGGEWDLPFVPGLTLNGRVIYTGESFANELNTLVLPEWTRVDIGARYTFASPWSGKPIIIRANIENLFDAAYWTSYRTVSSAVSLGAPRTYLVSTTFNF